MTMATTTKQPHPAQHTAENPALPEALAPLFTPWKIGTVEIKNRIVLTSMGGTNLLGWMEKNHFDETGAHFIRTIAENNVGLVLPGCQPVYNPMFGQWLYKNKRMYDDLAKWLPAFHQTGAKLFVQLTAGFGRSFTISPMMETLYTNPVLRFLSKPVMNLDKITASASEAPNRWSDKVPSRAMTVAEIQQMVEAFGKSAKLLKDAGVDGVEVHAVHEGYLLDQFTLKYVNHRTDAYGGSRENRYRFPVDIVREIKRVCGENFPVSLRYSVESKTKGFRQGALPGEEYTEVGRDMEESRWAARYLQDAGYDMLNCDNGTYDAWYWCHPPIYMPENCNLDEVKEIKKAVTIPVVPAGRMDPYVGAKEVAAGTIDGVGFARAFLADPEWVTKILEGRSEEIRPCICCHNACFNMSKWKGTPNMQELQDSLHLARCAVNAETMQWDKHYIKKTDAPKTVHIIGGGVGGMEAARVLKLRGHNPVIYEQTDRLGGVVIPGAAESYKKPMRDLLAWYRQEMERLDIPVHMNQSIAPDHDFGTDPVIVATGGKPISLSRVPGFDRTIEATDFLRALEGRREEEGVAVKKGVGRRVAVIGGSLTGCEIAYELALQGKEPFILEMKEDLIATEGVCLANSSYLREWFALHKVPVYLESTLVEVKEDAVTYKDASGALHEVPCDSVISAVGYRPDPLLDKAHTGAQTYFIGDCAGIGNIKTAVWQAYETAMKI
ncbi:FAD-dependent oxidoreductase [Murdochiella vaginalis]|uniref:oxidoreductase n=1 Tax=Murdochiella vaginalis TaxID=1852373 RepID=UPI000AF5AA50|nr:FAD-dependent oxidoreductase [Murdochiella vaginalis]